MNKEELLKIKTKHISLLDSSKIDFLYAKGYNEAKVNILGKFPYKKVNDTMEILFKITDRERKTLCLRIS